MRKRRDSLVSLVCRTLGRLLSPLVKEHSASPGIGASILIIKPCCIGDVLMATPTIDQLRRHFPHAHLAMAVGHWAKAVVANNPHLDEIIPCDGVGGGTGWSLRGYLALLREVRRRRFDVCLVLERSPLLTTLPFLAGIPRRLGLDSAGRGFSLNHPVPCPSHRHEVLLYLDALGGLGIQPFSPRLQFFPSTQDQAWAEERLPLGPWMALHPGGGHNPGNVVPVKRWPAVGFAVVANHLMKGGMGTILVGSEEDKAVAAQIKSQLGGDGQVLDFTGETSLGQLGALLHRCRLFIGNDAGPLHLAAAVDTPAVGIFGPSDPQRYGPFSPRCAVVYKNLPCGPCVEGGQGVRCSDPKCMAAISPQEVWQAAESLLNNEPASSHPS
ncbi:MAG: lipopolysaccharide heptosyltransferase II [Chloroflexi bacterium]|nr:lipopolysaccharide heptosyltransferase II [Chloroflexota bacterium]